MPGREKRLYQCGPFLLDPSNHQLSRDGTALPLPPKAFDTLLVLVENRGNLVGKDHLLKTVWPDTFVEENNITQYISLLRRLLGDVADQPQYIETVPRLGYRFVGPVQEVRAEERKQPATTAGIVDTIQKRASLEAGANKTEISRPTAIRFWHERPLALIASGFAILLVITAVALIALRLSIRTRSATSAPVPRRVVAVLGFKNLAANSEADWLSTALVEMLNTELSAGEHVRALSGEDIARVKGDLRIVDTNILSKKTLGAMRSRLGADVTVSGSYLELGSGADGQIRLDIELQDTISGETVGSIAETGTVSQLFQLIDRSGQQLRAKLGVTEASTEEDSQVRASLPSTSEVARLYSQGLARMRAFDTPQAQVLFAKALDIDPNFALGHSALAATWSALGYDQKAKTEAQRAFDLSNGMPREQRLLIAGNLYEMSHDWDKAVETYQQLFTLFPDNLEYGLQLMNAQTSAGKGNDAQATAAKLRALSAPSNQDPQIDLAEASAAESLGEFSQELQHAQAAAKEGQVREEHLLVARALVKQAWAHSRLGQNPEAVKTLTQARNIFSESGDRQGVASTVRLMAGVLVGNGDYAQAENQANEALRNFEQLGDKRGMAASLNTMATIHYEEGDLPSAKMLFQQALQIHREVGSKINIAGALGNIANVVEDQGQLAEAQKLTEESLQVFSEVGDQRALGTAHANLADLLYQQGNLSGSKEHFEEALKIHRGIGYQRGVAFDLSGQSLVAEAQDDLATARKEQEEALAIRTNIGEKQNAAASTIYLGELALYEGDPNQAEGLAARAVDLLGSEKSSNNVWGELVLARAFLAQGKISDAGKAVNRAANLGRSGASIPQHFESVIVTAYVETANAANRQQAGEVRRSLAVSIQQAKTLGYVGYEFRLRLALGEIEMTQGQTDSGLERLKQLVRDASSNRFELVARLANGVLQPRKS